MFNRGYSCDVTARPAHCLGGKRRVASLQSTCKTVAEGGIMGAQCNLLGSEPFYGVMRPLDFQKARCFLADGGMGLFGVRQVFLHWRDVGAARWNDGASWKL